MVYSQGFLKGRTFSSRGLACQIVISYITLNLCVFAAMKLSCIRFLDSARNDKLYLFQTYRIEIWGYGFIG